MKRKIGEPTVINGKKVQLIKAIKPNTSCYNCCFYSDRKCLIPEITHEPNSFYIEIKQNKEDMEEKKLNLKPFSLELAKQGKPVCTRDGREARIICFDKKGDQPIVALVMNKEKGTENIGRYFTNGHLIFENAENNGDLMMLSEKKEGWIKVKKDVNLYATKEEADRKMIGNTDYVSAKVEWEE